jgi:hypothetical protein
MYLSSTSPSDSIDAVESILITVCVRLARSI